MPTQVRQDTFRFALIVQIRVLGALVLREMRVRYGQSQLGYIWALLEPVGYVTIMTSLFVYVERPPPFGDNIALFFALGVIPFKMHVTISNQLTSAMNANRALLTYPIVRELDTIIARFILEAITTIVIFLVCILGLNLIYDIPGPSHPLRILQGIALVMFFALGVGLSNSVIIRWIPSWRNVYKILTAPLLFLSAVFYNFEELPTQLRDYVTWNPIAHGVEMVRDGYYAHYRATGLDGEYAFACGLALVVFGLFGERYYRSAQVR